VVSGEPSGGRRPTTNIGGGFALPQGHHGRDIAAWLRYLVGRHQALRTRYRLDPDGGLPQQVLFSDGELPLDVFDTDDDPAAVADAAWERSRGHRVRIRARVADPRHPGPAARRADPHGGDYCHLATDSHGIGVLPLGSGQRADRPAATGHAGTTADRWPRSSGAGPRCGNTTRRCGTGPVWREPLRHAGFGDSTDQRSPRYRYGN